MKTFLVLSVILIGVNVVAAVTHSLQYFYTATSGIPNFPEFVNLGMVDGVQVDYYDSNIRKVIPKQDWMAQTEDSEYWERQTQTSIGAEQSFKANIDIVKRRFNQTGGVHINQKMYGCEWDDETQQVTGYRQDGYDGEDFLVWDMKTSTYIAPKPQALITTNRWNGNRAKVEQEKNYLTQECPEWLKKYVDYGRSSLMRTDLPSVSFLQKTSSSPVSCHATGFYPKRAEMFWRKDGVEIHDGVDKGEINPNNDGTFQMSVDIDLRSVPNEDWPKYECVFQLSGVKEDIAKRLEKTGILTNESNANYVNISFGVLVLLGILGFIGVISVIGLIGWAGFSLYKKYTAKRPPSPVNGPAPEETQCLSQA